MKKDRVLHEKNHFVDVRDFIEQIGERFAGKPAYSYRLDPRAKESTKKNYDVMRDDVRALSTELIAKGFSGKHIAVIGKLSYPWVLMYYSTMCVGSVIVPLDKDWAEKDLADTVVKADVALVVADKDIAEKCKNVAEAAGAEFALLDGEGEGSVYGMLEEGKVKFDGGNRSFYETKLDPDAMAELVFTSGTTGKGKGVMLSQTAILQDMINITPYIDFSFKTVGVLPPHHTYGSSVSILGHNSIGVEVYLSAGLRYILKELKEEKPGHLVLVPLYLETFYRRILANIKDQGKEKLVFRMMKISNALRKVGIDLRRVFFGKILAAFGGELKMMISGGAAINQDIVDLFDGLGISVLNGYGITECAPLIAVNTSYNITNGSVGSVIDCDTVKIDDPNEDGEGEILVKGPNVMLGYYKDEEATAAAMTEDGFFRTGDYGKIGKNGALFITGRKKNLIILSNGKNVYPEEIENEFVSVPGTLDIVVYEGKSRRGDMYNAIVAEIFPDRELLVKMGIDTPEKEHEYFQKYVNEYNKNAVQYKKIAILKVRTEEFPKNTLRKIMRFKMDMSID